MNFEPVLKRVVVSFFDPCATVFWETWGVLGTNLVPRARDLLVSVEGEVKTSWRQMAASEGFPPCVVKVAGGELL